MRRLHRILLNICSTFMALAFIVLLVFVPLGYYGEYDIIWGGQHRCASVWTSWGRVWMNVGRTQGEFPSDVVEKGWVFGSQANQPADTVQMPGFSQQLNFGGFRVFTGVQSSGQWIVLSLPAWFAPMLTGSLPGIRAIRYVGRIRQIRRDADAAARRCPACGYDCRATPDRCPECGRETPGN